MKSAQAIMICGLMLLMGCGGPGKESENMEQTGNPGNGGPSKPAEPVKPPDPLSTPRGSMKHQLGLLLDGKTDELKACLTPRLRDRITPELAAEGKAMGAGTSFEDLYASETFEEYEGMKTCKVKMKNGRTLTTLVLEDGKWLADTIWFH